MKELTPPYHDANLPTPESVTPYQAWHSSGRIVCGGCGDDDVKANWMIFDIEASSGPRDNTFSYKPTVTRGFLLCPKCYVSVPAGLLRNAISDAYAVPAPTDYDCITLCLQPRRDEVMGRRLHVPRRWTKCPACHRLARVFKIGQDETPRTMAQLARIANV